MKYNEKSFFDKKTAVKRAPFGSIRPENIGRNTVFMMREKSYLSRRGIAGGVSKPRRGIIPPYPPSSPYSASKAASDHLARAWHATPLTILNALEGKPVGVYGNGENARDWLHVDDHAAALIAILERGHQGTGSPPPPGAARLRARAGARQDTLRPKKLSAYFFGV